jgi:hypothetical protein
VMIRVAGGRMSPSRNDQLRVCRSTLFAVARRG